MNIFQFKSQNFIFFSKAIYSIDLRKIIYCLCSKKTDFQSKNRVPKFFHPFRRKGKEVFSSTKCKFCIYKDTSCYKVFIKQKFYLVYLNLDQSE